MDRESAKLYSKVLKVISSCQTLEQLSTAQSYAILSHSKLFNTADKIETRFMRDYIGTCIEHKRAKIIKMKSRMENEERDK
jgi:hypothetical protein